MWCKSRLSETCECESGFVKVLGGCKMSGSDVVERWVGGRKVKRVDAAEELREVNPRRRTTKRVDY